MNNGQSSVSVCVLAHNEERSIVRTLKALLNCQEGSSIPITVYANGCTDKTIQLVSDFSIEHPNVRCVEIVLASKINAWNTAFLEQTSEIVVFTDGDIVPEENAVFKLEQDLLEHNSSLISTTRLFPLMSATCFEQKIVGFMQLPLKHEYLSGGMYAVRRIKLAEKFKEKGLFGIPMGITGEDYFLERLIEESELIISKCKNFYQPPTIKDYIRYLARIKWQNEQMKLVLGIHRDLQIPVREVIRRKLSGQGNIFYLCASLPAVILRVLFKKIYAKQIQSAYKKLGAVSLNGEQILTAQTRSHSTK